jgi:hypothetical protein
MERAITIIRHHLLEYVNCFSLKATAPDIELDAEAMEVHLQKKFWIRGRTSVSMSHLEGYGPSKELRKMGRLLPALKYLQSQGKIDLTPQGRTFYVKYLPSPKRQA